jgi:tetratricopeptide (TPR) repeat protein
MQHQLPATTSSSALGSDRPLVFVAMPFGKKRDAQTNAVIDFDAIYRDGIQPAVAGLRIDMIRADEERGGGVVHLPMFERLLVAEIAIVDVTIENANVFYELGVRHTARPQSTIVMRARGTQMPFDIKLIRAVVYELENGVLTPAAAAALVEALRGRLVDALRETLDDRVDSPLFQLIPEFPRSALAHEVCESFRDRVKQVNDLRDRLSAARHLAPEQAIPAIRAIEDQIGEITSMNAESAIDVMLSYRDVNAWEEMIALIERFPDGLARNVTVREQYGLALNRRNRGNDRQKAVATLEAVIAERGDNAETCALIGRIYKDYYKEANEAGDRRRARGSLEAAIEWYRRGFNADPRDTYPGINLATLLVLEGSEKSQKEVVRVAAALSFALARLQALSSTDYWTLATVLESAVLDNDWDTVDRAMGRALNAKPSLMQLETTHNNLRLILEAKPPHIDSAELETIVADFASAIERLKAATVSA